MRAFSTEQYAAFDAGLRGRRSRDVWVIGVSSGFSRYDDIRCCCFFNSNTSNSLNAYGLCCTMRPRTYYSDAFENNDLFERHRFALQFEDRKAS